MKLEQRSWTRSGGWDGPSRAGAAAQVALVFGATAALSRAGLFAELRALYPRAQLFGCSTAGEIRGTSISDDGVVVTALELERSTARTVAIPIRDVADGRDAGARLAAALPTDGLRHVLVLSDGLAGNGSELVKGLTGALPREAGLTGGLAGDGERFKETLVVHGDRAE